MRREKKSIPEQTKKRKRRKTTALRKESGGVLFTEGISSSGKPVNLSSGETLRVSTPVH